jgi:chemotaxis protein MotB
MPLKRSYQRFEDDEAGAKGGWQIVYTSFVLILLSFFIMLSTFATMDPARVLRFTRSFAKAVNVLTGGLGFERGESVMNPSVPVVDKQNELADIFHAIEDYTEALEIDKEIELASSAKGVVMTLADKALFRLGEAQVTASAQRLLNKIGAIVSQTGYYVRIEGHTDNLPIQTERFPSNWELSTARAVNVLRYFVEKLGIPARRLSAAGFGEFQPKYANDTAENRARNRRVEIIFTATDQDSIPAEGSKL